MLSYISIRFKTYLLQVMLVENNVPSLLIVVGCFMLYRVDLQQYIELKNKPESR